MTAPGKTNRSKIGQVVFSENETDDTSNLDAINVAGLSLGANNEDTVVWEWYNGIIYVLKGQPMGTIPYQGATLYLKVLHSGQRNEHGCGHNRRHDGRRCHGRRVPRPDL